MVYVYAIYSSYADIIYVGMSENPYRRLIEHNSGKSQFTKSYRPWLLFYQESHNDYKEARIREKQLKNATGKQFLRNKLKDINI